ncbi:MAG: ABC transporter ATP-binding protein [Anaerolineaceae bacterium]|jgi:ABC-2 type transport system ATP-binding protein|nr:ABC transporter ATP-binding protein [Anaerolineaceae bacterium]
MESVIRVDNLCYRYGKHLAVDHLSFDAQPGDVLGLLGPNGAGKTTTVRLLNGLLEPASGQLRVLGMDPVTQGCDLRRHTGVLTETPALYERLTARQNLTFFGTMAGMDAADRESRITELLDFFDLSARAGDRVAVYSKGMKQRLALARALLHRPKILFLDEPTSGLDPEASQSVHDLIETVSSQNGQTVLLCTHNLIEAERLCDRLVILDRGKLLASGSLNELRNQYAPGLWVNLGFLNPLPAGDGALKEMAAFPGVLDIVPESDQTLALRVAEEAVIPALVVRLVAQGAALTSLVPRQVSLEDIYFHLRQGISTLQEEV